MPQYEEILAFRFQNAKTILLIIAITNVIAILLDFIRMKRKAALTQTIVAKDTMQINC